MLFSWLFLFIDFFLENQNFGRKPYFSIWFLMIFSSGFSILYPGHEFCIFITCWPRDLLHFVWVCAAHNILMQYIYIVTFGIFQSFFPRGEKFSFTIWSKWHATRYDSLIFGFFTAHATLSDRMRMCCLPPESYCSSEKTLKPTFCHLLQYKMSHAGVFLFSSKTINWFFFVI